MSTSVMERIAEASPRFKARIAGLFYMLTMLTAGFALVARGRLVVNSDAAATATNILMHEPLFRSAFAADLIAIACYLAVTLLFYDMFKPVNRSLSSLAALFSLAGCAIGALGCVFHLAPLAVLKGARYLSVFEEPLQVLALMFLKWRAQASAIGFVFFGFYCLLIGYLIFKSAFLPRIVGALMALAGLGWLTFLSPPLANYLSPYILVAGLLGEGSLTLWLLVIGVNVHRWKEQASAAVEYRVRERRAILV